MNEPADPEVRAWLDTWRSRREVDGRCVTASFEGRRRFPALRLAYGCAFSAPLPEFLIDLARGEETGAMMRGLHACVHFWLVEPEGGIVDPTLHQFRDWREVHLAEVHPDLRFSGDDFGRLCMGCRLPILAPEARRKPGARACCRLGPSRYLGWLFAGGAQPPEPRPGWRWVFGPERGAEVGWVPLQRPDVVPQEPRAEPHPEDEARATVGA